MPTHQWRAIEWARNVAADPNAVYLDTETTGVRGDAEIVDIAVIAADGHVAFESLVKPPGSIPLEASRIHGIFDGDVQHEPDWAQIAETIFPLLKGRRIVAYNADYDRRILATASASRGLRPPDSRWECAMQAYAAFVGRPGRFDGFHRHKLDDAARSFGIQPGGHRAVADAEVCRQVVHAMAVYTRSESR